MSLKTRRQFSKDFKLQVLRELDSGRSPAQVCREHELHPNCLSKWRGELRQYGERAFSGNGKAVTSEAKIAELERMIGQLTVENSFLKKVLARQEAMKDAKK